MKRSANKPSSNDDDALSPILGKYDPDILLRPWERRPTLPVLKEAANEGRNQTSGPSKPLHLVLGLLASLLLSLLVALFPVYFNASMAQYYYIRLLKPTWIPPDWFLVTAWIVAHILTGLAGWFIWISGGLSKRAHSLCVFALTLGVEAIITDVAMYARNLSYAMYLTIACATFFFGLASALFWLVKTPLPLPAFFLLMHVALLACIAYTLNTLNFMNPSWHG